jgi:2-keto-4-pentenoate hydratase/2-oxohepta-3-ene-1,7-dioic acid hydratase in catechol pathway
MKLVTYLQAGSGARSGVLIGNDQVLDLSGAAEASNSRLPTTVVELLELGSSGLELAATVVEHAGRFGVPTIPLSEVSLLSPIPRPGKMLAVAGNYTEHLKERGHVALEKSQATVRPFLKPSNSVIGTDSPIYFPRWSNKLDYEAELAIVIGKHAKYVSAEEAPDFIAGYSVFNDVTGRELTIGDQRVERDGDRFFDWLAGKWFDSFAVLGPSITTSDDVEDPHNLQLTLDLNGERRQDTSTGQMIFDCYELVSFFSHLTTLEPGDVIATGTPSGVGAATGRYLQAGDVMEASINGLGTIRNPVVESA